MNKRHYEHTLPNIRGSLSNTYEETTVGFISRFFLSVSYQDIELVIIFAASF